MSWLLYTLLHNHTQNDAVQVKEDLKVNDYNSHCWVYFGTTSRAAFMSELLVYSRADKLFCSKLDPGSWKTSQQEKAWSIHTHTQGTVVVCGGQSIITGSSWHWLNVSCNSSIATFLSTAMLIQLRINILSSVSTMNKSNLLPAIWTKLLSHLYKDQKVRYSILVLWEVKCLVHVCKTDADWLWI